eukprot:GGOE01008304.1.p3 GENE.GGOE01008304.1~~GGOE01008304.1.p3  ORF type:complete len:127 (-),score=2.66 GGOE01008304.1:1067-1447(-)
MDNFHFFVRSFKFFPTQSFQLLTTQNVFQCDFIFLFVDLRHPRRLFSNETSHTFGNNFLIRSFWNIHSHSGTIKHFSFFFLHHPFQDEIWKFLHQQTPSLFLSVSSFTCILLRCYPPAFNGLPLPL